MSETTKEIPIWVGGESGQRKRYLRSLEKDLATELGPDWHNAIEAWQTMQKTGWRRCPPPVR